MVGGKRGEWWIGWGGRRTHYRPSLTHRRQGRGENEGKKVNATKNLLLLSVVRLGREGEKRGGGGGGGGERRRRGKRRRSIGTEPHRHATSHTLLR